MCRVPAATCDCISDDAVQSAMLPHTRCAENADRHSRTHTGNAWDSVGLLYRGQLQAGLGRCSEHTEAIGAAVPVPSRKGRWRRRRDRQVLHGCQAGEQLPHESQQRCAAAGARQHRVRERLEARQELQLLLGALQIFACIDDSFAQVTIEQMDEPAS